MTGSRSVADVLSKDQSAPDRGPRSDHARAHGGSGGATPKPAAGVAGRDRRGADDRGTDRTVRAPRSTTSGFEPADCTSGFAASL